METIRTTNGKIVRVFAETFDEASRRQVIKLAECADYKKSVIRIMPDCHAGAGCTIGTTMTIYDRITPNLVGVDIGCGMLVVELKNKDISFRKLDNVIREHIPCGMNIHKRAIAEFDFSGIRCPKFGVMAAQRAIGTLGGGNHFIEVDWSEKTRHYYLVIHSGSRNPGLKICEYYQKLAMSNVDAREEEFQPLNYELATLKGQDFDDYLNDMRIMQDYASVNRQTMADIILAEMHLKATDKFETIHNYIDFSRMILRKGAVRAEKGERLIIPINMRDGSLICIGKGNRNWNYSAPHGAGRLMSRNEAFKNLSLDEYKQQMKGIYSTTVCPATLDESPMAYKSADEILRAIKPTADVIDQIRPVYNFKAAEK